MQVKCIPIKELYCDSIHDYRVVSCSLIDTDEYLKLNKYGNFTISGSNISSLKLNQEANLILAPDTNSKYEASYIMLGYVGVNCEQGTVNIAPEFELEILSRLMDENQAINVNKAYPRFVNMVLNGQEEQISYKNIYNVGKVRLPEYIKKVKDDCGNILFYPIAYENGITSSTQVRELASKYDTVDALKLDFETIPYHVYMDVLNFSFDKADKLVLAHHENFISSKHRCEYACVEVLKQNELLGDTRLQVKFLVHEVKQLTPEAIENIKEAVKNSQVIHYDEASKYVALKSTYEAERTIASHILERLNNKIPEFLPMNWTKFKEVDGVQFTEEQIKILKIVGEGARIALLTGSAGCVDCDTEFFTGNEWKRIADYEQGDKVLQYNMDGSAELVEPLAYIKKPCDNLWHFETKYGVNQTVCEEHRIVYWSAKGQYHETNIKDIIGKQSPENNGWTGKFKTSFSYGSKGIDLTDSQIKVMCAVICDGSFFGNQNDKHCRFHIKKDRKKERLREIFAEANIKWRETESAEKGYTDFYIQAPRREKEFTEYWYGCNHHQLQVICDNILFWDGSTNKTKKGKERKVFSTSVKVTADFIQFAYSACGYRATICESDRVGQEYITCEKWYTRKSKEYRVIITNRNFVGICCDSRRDHKRTPITQVPTTDGYKYCFTVPSSMLVLRRKNCIFITGNCGKTSSMKALIRMLEAYGKSYTLLAPTGIASKRLSESTGRKASTIHMALATGIEPTDYLVIEESSMVSVHLLASLLDRIEYNPNLIFVCDEAQLASISCGNVLQDIINSNIVPRANLTRPFRYGTSGLITIATDTRNGQADNLLTKFDDFEFIEIENDSVSQVVEQYESMLQQGFKKDEILILSPYNRGNKGTYVINKKIQAEYNPHEYSSIKYKHPLGEIQFKVGDRVLNTKNDYHMPCIEFDEDGYESYGVMFCANGDIGTVRECRQNSEGKDELVIEFDNGIAAVSGSAIQNLILGYAISVHKCVTGDTLVLTNKGIKTIQNLFEATEKNDSLMIYNGQYFEHPENFVKNIPLPCKTITLKNGSKITGTLEHGLTTIEENGKLKRVNIGDIKIGDYIGLKVGTDIYGSNTDLSGYKVKRSSREKKGVIIPTKLSEDLATLFGYLCADGTVYKRGLRFAKKSEEVVDCCIGIAKKEFNVNPKKYYKIEKSRGKNGAWYGEINSTEISRWLLTIGGFAPNNKYVPDCILEAPKNIQRKFLRGLFEDGTVNIKQGKFDHIEFTTVYKKCVYQVQNMLLNMGIISYVKKYVKKSNKFAYHLYIYKKDSLKYKKDIGFISNHKQERLDKYLTEDSKINLLEHIYIPNIKQLCAERLFDKKNYLSPSLKSALYYFTDKMLTKNMALRLANEIKDFDSELATYLISLSTNFIFFPVSSIASCIEKTYCFEMPETHQFIQNGFAGWNCQGAQSRGIIALVAPEHNRMISRNLLYVEFSRSQEKMIVIGDIETIKEGLEVQENMERDTFLEDMLNEQVQY